MPAVDTAYAPYGREVRVGAEYVAEAIKATVVLRSGVYCARRNVSTSTHTCVTVQQPQQYSSRTYNKRRDARSSVRHCIVHPGTIPYAQQ